MSDYFSDPSVNWSSLKHLRVSPLCYKHQLTQPFEASPAMLLGRVTHTLVFEPEKFAAEHVIWEGGDRRGKEWKEFAEDNAGKTIFRQAEIDLAILMADAVKRHPLVQPYLVDGIFEQSIKWTDPDNGLVCKGKPDWLQPKRKTLVDLKTTVSIAERRFSRDVANFGYHCQLGLYRQGIEYALGWRPQKVVLVAVENKPPHDVAVFALDEDALTVGLDEVKQLMQTLIVCRAQDKWPGRYTEERALQLPAYIYGKVEFEPETGE